MGKENDAQQQRIVFQRIIIFSFFLALTLVISLYLVSKSRKKIKFLVEELHKKNLLLKNRNEDLLVQKKELKSLLMAKNRFVSVIGHDLKNPFSGLLGMLELLNNDWDEMHAQDIRESIKPLYDTSVQTYSFLEELLSWGKTQEGIIKSQPDAFNVKEVLGEVATVFTMNLKKKNLTLSIMVTSDFKVYTDRKLFSQIMQNFLGNAIKYSQLGESITISVENIGGKIHICVQDHGIGIPSDKVESIFELNSNFGRPGTQGERSSGMRLVLSKEYAHIMGAEVTVTSEVDKGSRFCLLIDHHN